MTAPVVTHSAYAKAPNGGDSGAVTATLGSTTTGEAILVVVTGFGGGFGAGHVTDNKGNTYAFDGGGTSGNLQVGFYSCLNPTGGAGHTVTVTFGSAGGKNIGAVAVQNIVTSSAKDKTTSASGTGTALNSGTTATLAQADEIAVGVGVVDTGGVQTWSRGGGFTDIGNTGDGANDLVSDFSYKVLAATTGIAASFTWPQSDPWLAAVMTYKATSGGAQSADGTTGMTFAAAATAIKQFVCSGAAAVAFVLAGAVSSNQLATGTAGVVFGGSASAADPVASGTTGVTFGGSGAGVKQFVCSGTTGLTFGQTAAGVYQQPATGSAGATFGGSGSPISKQAATGTAPVNFNLSSDGTVIKTGAGTTGIVFTPAGDGQVFKTGAGTTGLAFSVAATGTRSTAGGGSAGVSFGGAAAPLAGNLAAGATGVTFTPAGNPISKQAAVGATSVRFFPWASPALPAASGVTDGLPFEYALRGNQLNGDPVVASAHDQRDRDLETYLADVARVPDADVWHNVGAAGEPTFQNFWTNFGSGYVGARFRREGDVVRVEGLIKGGNAGTVAFTLPPGYRPSSGLMVVGITHNGSAEAALRIDIGTGGTVAPLSFTGTSAYTSLSFTITVT